MAAAEAVTLRQGRASVDLDRRGAVITGFRWRRRDGREGSVMRDGLGYDGDPLKASCFPMLPFCNRVRDNRFTLDGAEYRLAPNQPWDRHYLHGDGWLSRWNVVDRSDTSVTFGMRYDGGLASPYAYSAEIRYRLQDEALTVTLSVRNEAPRVLPFGLGLHPYFRLTPRTTLQAAATGWFAEEAEFLPGALGLVPQEVDFSASRSLPRHWINNGFTGWDGTAEIVWPEQQLALAIRCSPLFRHYFVFMSDTRFEPGFADDYFCFEPMTHCADAHNAADLGGLVALARGESLSAEVTFTPHDHVSAAESET
jgi:aldose 1-epimerase